jgi:hypothetical protein
LDIRVREGEKREPNVAGRGKSCSVRWVRELGRVRVRGCIEADWSIDRGNRASYLSLLFGAAVSRLVRACSSVG